MSSSEKSSTESQISRSDSNSKQAHELLIHSLKKNSSESGLENTFIYYFEALNYEQFWTQHSSLALAYTDSFEVFFPLESRLIPCVMTVMPSEKTFSLKLVFDIPEKVKQALSFKLAISLYSKSKKYFLMKIKERPRIKRKDNTLTYDSICDMERSSSQPLLSPFIFRLVISPEIAQLTKSSEYIGIANKGNTCYMNAVLQALFNLPVIRNQILTMNLEQATLVALKHIFYHLLSKGSQLSSESVRTLALFEAFKWDKSFWNAQQDAEEIFSLIYNDLIAVETKLYKEDKDKVIANNFKGKLSTNIKCLSIDHTSTSKEEFLFLQLDLNVASSLDECIKNYFSIVELRGENQYQKSTKEFIDARKNYSLALPPNILCIQLKRFSFVREGNDTSIKPKAIKNCRGISYQYSLDMSPYCSQPKAQSKTNKDNEENDDYRYSLYGVIVHDGGINEGHYYALINNFNEEKWFLFNDSTVSYATPNEIFKENFGGEDWEISLEDDHLKKQMTEKDRTAYLLIYIKNSQIESIFNESQSLGILKSMRDQIKSANKNRLNGIEHKKGNNLGLQNDEVDRLLSERCSKMKRFKGMPEEDVRANEMARDLENLIRMQIMKPKLEPLPVKAPPKLFTDFCTPEELEVKPLQHNPLNRSLQASKQMRINSKAKSTTTLSNHRLGMVTPNKCRMSFNFIDNKTASFIGKSSIIYCVNQKMLALKLYYDCFFNLSAGDKDIISMQMIKLTLLNPLGFLIRIIDENETINDLLNQVIQRQLILCFYVLDIDFTFDIKQPHHLISFNFFKENFLESDSNVSFELRKPPCMVCLCKDSKAMHSEKDFIQYLTNIIDSFKAKINEEKGNRKVKEGILDNCSSSMRQINNFKMLKVMELDCLKVKEIYRLIKVQIREKQPNDVIRLVIESEYYQ